MRFIGVTILLFTFVIQSQGQAHRSLEEDTVIYNIVDRFPAFAGCDHLNKSEAGKCTQKSLLSFISSEFKTPEGIDPMCSRVFASFVVEKDGSMSQKKVERPCSPELETEVLRVLDAMPPWTPGKLNDKTVRVRYSVPIHIHFR